MLTELHLSWIAVGLRRLFPLHVDASIAIGVTIHIRADLKTASVRDEFACLILSHAGDRILLVAKRSLVE